MLLPAAARDAYIQSATVREGIDGSALVPRDYIKPVRSLSVEPATG